MTTKLCLLVWILCCGVRAPAQTRPAKDPFLTIAAMPAQPPHADGRTLTVRDGASKEPVAGASVVVITAKGWTPELDSVRQALVRRHAGDTLLGALAFAAQVGRKWKTDADGTVRIPTDAMFCYAVAGRRFGTNTGEKTADLFPRNRIRVIVREHDGAPSAGAGVHLMHGKYDWNHAPYHTVGTTDADGLVQLEVPPQRDNTWPTVAVGAPIIPDATCPVELVGARHMGESGERITLTLPKLARVRLRAVDGKGTTQPLLYSSVQGKRRCVLATPRGQPIHELRVPLGKKLEIHVGCRHLIHQHVVKVQAPAEHGAIVDVTAQPRDARFFLEMRLLVQGKPFANRSVVLSAGHWAKTNSEGRLGIALQPWHRLDTPLILRGRRSGLGPVGPGKSFGAIRVKLTGLESGINDLGDQTLIPEPLLCGGVIVDDAGSPIPRVRVSWQVGNSPRWAISTLSDDRGRFALHALTGTKLQRVGLQLVHGSYEAPPTANPFAPQVEVSFGQRDARIVMQRREDK